MFLCLDDVSAADQSQSSADEIVTQCRQKLLSAQTKVALYPLGYCWRIGFPSSKQEEVILHRELDFRFRQQYPLG